MTSLPTYLVNEGLTSREGCRIFEGVCSVLRDTGMDTLSIKGLDINIEPVQEFFKSVDSAWYLPKAIGDTTKISNSAADFKRQLHIFMGYGYIKEDRDEGTILRTASSFLTMVKDVFKFIADSSASLKFLGTLGVSYLAPRVKVLGLSKNAFAVYCAVHGIAVETIKLYDDAYVQERPDRAKRMVVSFLSIIGFLCSTGLNGFGALQTLFGSQLAQAGKQVMTPFAFNCWKLGGSLSGLMSNTIKQFA
jgi:hypothetical protein